MESSWDIAKYTLFVLLFGFAVTLLFLGICRLVRGIQNGWIPRMKMPAQHRRPVTLVPQSDPRHPGFAVWAAREYDKLFGEPKTHEEHEKRRDAILGWAYLALDCLSNPPSGQRRELEPAEAAWFNDQLQLFFKHMPKATKNS